MNKLLEHFGKFENLWLKIPFLLYGVGFLIHNIYLTKYSFFDFEIIQTKYIYTGLTAILFIVLIFIAIILRLDLDKADNNFKLKNFLAWAIRLPVLAIVLNVYLGNNKSFIAGLPLQIIGENLSNKISIILVGLSHLYLMGLLIVSLGSSRTVDQKIINPARIVINVLSVPLFAIVIMSTFNNKDLSSIFTFLLILFVWVFSYLAGFSDGQKGISFISTPIKGKESNIAIKLNRLIPNIFYSSVLLGALYSYSINLYPLLPINLGGVKPVEIEIQMKDSSIKGSLILESPKWFLIQEVDSTISRIRVDDILRIKTSKKKK